MIPEWYAKAVRADLHPRDAALRQYSRWEYGDTEAAWLTAAGVADSRAPRLRRARVEPLTRRGPFLRLASALLRLLALKGPAERPRSDRESDGGPRGPVDEDQGHSSPTPRSPAELPTPRE